MTSLVGRPEGLISKEDFVTTVRRLSRVGRCCDNDDEALVTLFARTLEIEVQVQLSNFIIDRGEHGLLHCYQSDGWSRVLKTTSRVFVDSAHSISRNGKFRHEFILQRSFLKYLDSTGSPHVMTVFSEPKAMRLGKCSWTFFDAYQKFTPIVRSLKENIHLSIWFHIHENPLRI